jgi:hypothetical protein
VTSFLISVYAPPAFGKGLSMGPRNRSREAIGRTIQNSAIMLAGAGPRVSDESDGCRLPSTAQESLLLLRRGVVPYGVRWSRLLSFKRRCPHRSTPGLSRTVPGRDIRIAQWCGRVLPVSSLSSRGAI